MLTLPQMDAILRELVAAGTAGVTSETYAHHQEALKLLTEADAINAHPPLEPINNPVDL